jgi:hypothetical protein
MSFLRATQICARIKQEFPHLSPQPTENQAPNFAGTYVVWFDHALSVDDARAVSRVMMQDRDCQQ